ncbi:PAS/PAC sensor signal transduction histidine kinase [Filimonas lacunae]|uniref:histidine kinase n=1 Tax=Filimonas lacunae TaxID=477680 RepID=A0A173MIA2_9BACT|nr:ATP-binding protein [Filimonas lacunae]BAV07220.1 sensory box histidine kinase [Filimonas lacunae]SIS93060.1 PAS/PAC sensor signal transduction histidine kinase [Filimonas lacunae]
MRIKTKLTLGIGLLFTLLLVLTIVSSVYVNALKNDTENILVSNYNTLEYARKMILALDQVNQQPQALQQFTTNLQQQKANVTEPGEKEATLQLEGHFTQYCKDTTNKTVAALMRQDLSTIMMLNMQAIQRKSNKAVNTSHNANMWIAVAGTLCFIIAFTMWVNLPGNIANPVKELTSSIKQIANKNYAQRIHYTQSDEFGELASSFNTMAEKLQEYDNSNLSKLLVEKKRIETLINNMHDPVIGLDENKRVLFANEEAIRISGLPANKLIGHLSQDVAVHNDLIRLLIRDMMQPEANSPKAAPIKIYADGKESYFEKDIITISITPTGETQKKHLGHVIVLRNITPFKELDFAKTNFIATVSHELKTPISSIKLGVQLLEKIETGSINEAQKQLLEGIKDDSNRLLTITGELLNLSQVETGNIQLSIQQSDPHKILKYALDAVKVQAELKQITLQVKDEPAIHPVKADEEKTAWVLINFLTNAIRYAPENTQVVIEIKNQDTKVQFSVKDSGRGIDPKYRDKIFDRYFQVPGSNRAGTGLGLAICKEFIEAQGGTIGVETEIGAGSNFYFRLLKG